MNKTDQYTQKNTPNNTQTTTSQQPFSQQPLSQQPFSQQTPSRRKPGIAALMSLILPGFGQLYTGQANQGILLFIAFALGSLAVPAIAALWLPSALILPAIVLSLLLTLLIWLYSIIQAWRKARNQTSFRLKDWQQPASYIGAFLLAMIILPALTQYVRGHLLESFSIPSSSMEPSILRGDLLFADKRYNCPGCKHHAERGDIAIFVYPNNRSLYYIKRIIGLPGDRVRITEQTVYINDQPLTQQQTEKDGVLMIAEQAAGRVYQVKWDKDDFVAMPEITVPPGAVFLLGDNRSASKDSREFGTVPLMDVVGKTRQIWFSTSEKGLRWQRLGQVID